MVFAVADRIADKTFIIDHHRAIDGLFEDAGLVAFARQSFGIAGAQGQDFHGTGNPSAIPFTFHIS
jgi:hypothetical protein